MTSKSLDILASTANAIREWRCQNFLEIKRAVGEKIVGDQHEIVAEQRDGCNLPYIQYMPFSLQMGLTRRKDAHLAMFLFSYHCWHHHGILFIQNLDLC
jgi:hypothetical protein